MSRNARESVSGEYFPGWSMTFNKKSTALSWRTVSKMLRDPSMKLERQINPVRTVDESEEVTISMTLLTSFPTGTRERIVLSW